MLSTESDFLRRIQKKSLTLVWLTQFEATLAQYDIALVDVKQTNFAIVTNMENSRNAELPNIIIDCSTW